MQGTSADDKEEQEDMTFERKRTGGQMNKNTRRQDKKRGEYNKRSKRTRENREHEDKSKGGQEDRETKNKRKKGTREQMQGNKEGIDKYNKVKWWAFDPHLTFLLDN